MTSPSRGIKNNKIKYQKAKENAERKVKCYTFATKNNTIHYKPL